MSVESINKARGQQTKEGSEDYSFFKTLANLTTRQFDTLVRRGDSLVVYPLAKFSDRKWEEIKDTSNTEVADLMLIRRTDGAKGVSIN